MKSIATLSIRIGMTLLAFVFPSALQAQYRSEKTLTLDTGGDFHLDACVGRVIIVTGSSEPGVKTVVTSNRQDLETFLDFSFEEGASAGVTLLHCPIASCSFGKPLGGGPGLIGQYGTGEGNNWTWYEWLHTKVNDLHNNWVNYEIQVPARTRVRIRTEYGDIKISSIDREVDLDTSGGSIEATDLASNLRAHTSYGNIDVERINGNVDAYTCSAGHHAGCNIRGSSIGGRTVAWTGSGSIWLKNVGGDLGGDLLAHTPDGSIHIEGARGRVYAQASDGSVDVGFTAHNDNGGDIGASGDVRVEIDRDAGVWLDASAAKSVSSTVRLAWVRTRSPSRLDGSIQGDYQTLRLRSYGGSVSITAR